MKKKIIAVTLIIVLFVVTFSVLAQSLEDQLRMQDRMIYAQFTTYYPRDNRYNAFFNEIATNLNSTIVDVFGQDKDIVFYVCPSHFGFNAMSFYRVIIFDSLLLDSLRYLAMAKAYYGDIDNEYVDELARSVATISRKHQSGDFRGINFQDQNNPFGLPPVGELTPQQAAKAQELFKGMLASWMCHEGSHCMLDHVKVRMQEVQNMQKKFYYQGNQQQFNNSLNAYAFAKINQKLEKEADIMATRWLIESGYTIEGFVLWLEFGEKLEKAMGVDNAYLRTHPKCSERIRYIKQAAREYTK